MTNRQIPHGEIGALIEVLDPPLVPGEQWTLEIVHSEHGIVFTVKTELLIPISEPLQNCPDEKAAYDEGYNHSGPPLNNPYERKSMQWQAWRDGWQQAAHDWRNSQAEY